MCTLAYDEECLCPEQPAFCKYMIPKKMKIYNFFCYYWSRKIDGNRIYKKTHLRQVIACDLDASSSAVENLPDLVVEIRWNSVQGAVKLSTPQDAPVQI